MFKKICAFVLFAGVLTSCYNTRVFVGNVKTTDPIVEVNSIVNHTLIYGLVPLANNDLKASTYMDNKTNYVVKNNFSFVDGVISCITFGIYTPTHTTFYVPLNK